MRPLLLLAATVRSTTSLLPLLEPRMGMKPAMTERTPSPREHTFPSPEPRKQKETEGARKQKKQKGKALLEPIRRTRKENSEDEEHCPSVGRLSAPEKMGQKKETFSCPTYMLSGIALRCGPLAGVSDIRAWFEHGLSCVGHSRTPIARISRRAPPHRQ